MKMFLSRSSIFHHLSLVASLPATLLYISLCYSVINGIQATGDDDTVRLEPWGGSQGKKWECTGDIRKIVVGYSKTIETLIFTYVEEHKLYNGTELQMHVGGPLGSKNKTITLGPHEYLSTISGNMTIIDGKDYAIGRLAFVNLFGESFGLVGSKEDGPAFSLPVSSGRILSYFGTVGHNQINSIGISLTTTGYPIGLGPWGGSGGEEWEFKDPVRKIKVLAENGALLSITFNGATRIGGENKTAISYPEVTLEADEYLSSISGTTGKHDNVRNLVKLISFVTNKRTYGPFGDEGSKKGVPFDARVKKGKITAFSGRAGYWIDAIAIHYYNS